MPADDVLVALLVFFSGIIFLVGGFSRHIKMEFYRRVADIVALIVSICSMVYLLNGALFYG